MTRYFLVVLTVVFALSTVHVPAQTRSKKMQSVRIVLDRRGYEPSEFRLRKGIPARVTFLRKTNDECGEVVVIPAYGIRRNLPLNQPVTVQFTPTRTGTFDFACGMDMLHGQIIVN